MKVAGVLGLQETAGRTTGVARHGTPTVRPCTVAGTAARRCANVWDAESEQIIDSGDVHGCLVAHLEFVTRSRHGPVSRGR